MWHFEAVKEEKKVGSGEAKVEKFNFQLIFCSYTSVEIVSI